MLFYYTQRIGGVFLRALVGACVLGLAVVALLGVVSVVQFLLEKTLVEAVAGTLGTLAGGLLCWFVGDLLFDRLDGLDDIQPEGP